LRYRLRLPLVLWLLMPLAQAHETITTKLTWTAEVSRIFEKRCVGCHGEGGPAPMVLATYAEVRPWAVAIREEVLERRMPPWNLVKGFGDFVNEGGLSQEEIQRIAEWVTGGAPQGEAQYLKPMSPPAMDASGPDGRGFRIQAGSVLDRALRIQKIRPVSVSPGASFKLTARTPAGRVEPLVWIRNYRPEWNRAYMYRKPVRLPKGTRLEVHPAQAATFEVYAPK
jgi:mono/diheme cytochrome c family protein